MTIAAGTTLQIVLNSKFSLVKNGDSALAFLSGNRFKEFVNFPNEDSSFKLANDHNCRL